METSLGYSNFSKEKWQAMRAMANDRSIVIKNVDKGSCVVVWDRNDYIAEAEKQFRDKNIYKDINLKDKILKELADNSDKLFKSLKTKGSITEKRTYKYFTTEFKKTTNLGRLYLLPKTQKRLENVPDRPIIPNCGTPTEKFSELLDSQLKPVMQSSRSYIKASGDLIKKIKNISTIFKDSILVAADVVGLHASIPHEAGLKALEKALKIVLVKTFQQKIWLKWPNLFLRTTISNLMVKLNSRFWEQQ